MKGLLKFLSPFAPDQSGAVSVLYGLDGITVICDAGGCTGNVCGFDEPRWFQQKSALFSAGLRDMDAILGRDDKLVEKLKDAAGRLDAKFAALIGTPVPAVIATDFKALTRMAEKRCGIPVVAIDCTGTRLYDQGASDTYDLLMKKFAGENTEFVDSPNNEKSENDETNGIIGNFVEINQVEIEDNNEDQKTGNYIGVLGVNPLDTSFLKAEDLLKQKLIQNGYDGVFCYGTNGLDELKHAPLVQKNLVISPSGLKAARQLEKQFGTPYEVAYPLLKNSVKDQLKDLDGKKVLVVHQQVAANEIRKEILKNADAEVTVATWFMLEDDFKESGDLHLETEKAWRELVLKNQFDVIIGDKMLKRAVREYEGQWIHIPHFAVSGEYELEEA